MTFELGREKGKTNSIQIFTRLDGFENYKISLNLKQYYSGRICTGFYFFLIFLILAFSLNNAYSQYELKNEVDYPLVGTAVVLGAGTYLLNSNVQPLDTNEISKLNKDDIFSIDRNLMSDYHSGIAKTSDYLLSFNMALPLILLTDGNVNSDPWKYGLMYFETVSLTASLTGLVKNIATRTRPFVYDKDLSIKKKLEKDGRQSFFSGHTSWSFASAVFISTIYSKLNPDSKYQSYVWGSTLLLATTTGILRIAAGKHYFTDVLTGAIVGSFVGWFIPYLHEKDLKESSKIIDIKSIKVFELKYGVF